MLKRTYSPEIEIGPLFAKLKFKSGFFFFVNFEIYCEIITTLTFKLIGLMVVSTHTCLLHATLKCVWLKKSKLLPKRLLNQKRKKFLKRSWRGKNCKWIEVKEELCKNALGDILIFQRGNKWFRFLKQWSADYLLFFAFKIWSKLQIAQLPYTNRFTEKTTS